MKIKYGQEQNYLFFKNDWKDLYGDDCFGFAEKWAELLEERAFSPFGDRCYDIEDIIFNEAEKIGIDLINGNIRELPCMRTFDIEKLVSRKSSITHALEIICEWWRYGNEFRKYYYERDFYFKPENRKYLMLWNH